jgi:hypothetical protein
MNTSILIFIKNETLTRAYSQGQETMNKEYGTKSLTQEEIFTPNGEIHQEINYVTSQGHHYTM